METIFYTCTICCELSTQSCWSPQHICYFVVFLEQALKSHKALQHTISLFSIVREKVKHSVFHCLLSPPGLHPADRRKMWQLQTAQTLSRTLLAFVVTFGVCWAPNHVMFLVYNLGVSVCTYPQIYHLTTILAICNSCVNPLLYALTNRSFRTGIKSVF